MVFPARWKTGKIRLVDEDDLRSNTARSMEFPYRTVFYGPCSGDEILWSQIEMFSCAKEWQGFEVMEFEKVEDVVITIMERTPQEVSRYTHELKKESKNKPQEKPRAVQETRKIRWK